MTSLQRIINLCLYLFLLPSSKLVQGQKGRRSGIFNVMNYGAKGDGRTDDSKAFMATWQAACRSRGSVRLLIPKANYLLGPVKFVGPCRKVRSMTVYMKGNLMAMTGLNRYGSSDWILFGWVHGLTLTGRGTFNGRGSRAWPFNKCPTNKICKLLPTSLKFVSMENTRVEGIRSLNSMFFHMAILQCKKFRASGLRISAPANSPNTDGIHIERSSDVTIHSSAIGTGDDCISVGHGNSQITISGITCGPGHGISVGSLGRYPNEGEVQGLIVRDSILSGTTNGVRIKTWGNSPGSSLATNMTFRDIVMDNVANPIIIDQTYCPYPSCSTSPSLVMLSDIFFMNIRGTSSSPVAVTLHCSKGVPCQNVRLQNIHLDYSSGRSAASSTCRNVKPRYTGTQIPQPCI